MRIAHISDLHICRKFKRRNISKLAGLIKQAINLGVQHFVFTGDIFDNASENDIKLFKQILIKFDLYKSNKTTLVVGNHDIFGGPQTANDVINFPSRCQNINYKEKVENFVGHFKELFEGAIHPDNDSLFPFAKEFRDVVLFGLNSIDQYSRFKNPFASNGKIDKPQRKFLNSLLSSTAYKEKIKIVLVHHHFYKNDQASKSSENNLWSKIENYTMKLRGKKKLLNIFQENDVKMVLHGHSHEMSEYFRKGIHFINSGGAMEGDDAQMFIIDAFPFDMDVSLVNIQGNKSFQEQQDSLIAVAV